MTTVKIKGGSLDDAWNEVERQMINKHKYNWIYGLAWKDEDIREIEVSRDGLMMRSELSVVRDLLRERPFEQVPFRAVWYFNLTKDREIAELWNDTPYVEFNPALLWQSGYQIVT